MVNRHEHIHFTDCEYPIKLNWKSGAVQKERVLKRRTRRTIRSVPMMQNGKKSIIDGTLPRVCNSSLENREGTCTDSDT
jgi:hypothetical protein